MFVRESLGLDMHNGYSAQVLMTRTVGNPLMVGNTHYLPWTYMDGYNAQIMCKSIHHGGA